MSAAPASARTAALTGCKDLDEAKVLNGVLEYCKANPTGRPVSALDELIRKATKLKAKWDAGTISWDN